MPQINCVQLVTESWSLHPGPRLPLLVGGGGWRVRELSISTSPHFVLLSSGLSGDLCPLPFRSEGSSPNWLQALKLKKKKV